MKGRLQTSRRPLKAILPRPQAYTTSTPSAPYSPDAERSTQPVSSPEKTSSNGHRTQRLRTGTNKALPLPPVIDPIVVSAKQRWREPKSDPDRKTFTDFQKKLYRNPFAHALATPVRNCTATQGRLPACFTTSLYLTAHPETGDPWLLPTALQAEAEGKPTPQQGAPYRIHLHQALLRHLGDRDRWDKCIPSRIHMRLKDIKRGVIWRQNMPELVCELLARTAETHLRWIFRNFVNPAHPKGSVVLANGATEVETVDNAACVLYLHSTENPHITELSRELRQITDKIEAQMSGIRRLSSAPDASPKLQETKYMIPDLLPHLKYPPLVYPTVRYRGGRLPVYDVASLIGEEKVKELIKGTPFEDARCVAIRESAEMREPQIALLRLQGYVAESTP